MESLLLSNFYEEQEKNKTNTANMEFQIMISSIEKTLRHLPLHVLKKGILVD